ncbi:SWIM zinc finger family protein [Micrococcus luteus]|uniref:SWIM zinc finger family protein n=1 Tax=Micrococcus luteus TaxID=1270 RepID=UPI0021CD0335|nr:SWIM zinc finger family protein [Micrococcus luteus]
MATADSGDVLPHLRTEAIRAVVGPTSADRGFAVAASGAVGRLRYDAATGRLSASVQGTAPSPYRVQVQLQEAYDDAAEDGAGALMEPVGGRCTCPVGTDCKHVAAALYQVVRLDADQALDDARRKLAEMVTTADALPAPAGRGHDGGGPAGLDAPAADGAAPHPLPAWTGDGSWSRWPDSTARAGWARRPRWRSAWSSWPSPPATRSSSGARRPPGRSRCARAARCT